MEHLYHQPYYPDQGNSPDDLRRHGMSVLTINLPIIISTRDNLRLLNDYRVLMESGRLSGHVLSRGRATIKPVRTQCLAGAPYHCHCAPA
jgi:hypothetical protein